MAPHFELGREICSKDREINASGFRCRLKEAVLVMVGGFAYIDLLDAYH